MSRMLRILLCATLCSAQTAGPVGAPAPLPRPQALITTTTGSGGDNASNYLTQCAPGELIPGPTCTSFIMCVGGSTFATRRFKFECAPGTIFSAELNTCIHAYGAKCATEGEASLPSGPHPTPTSAPCPEYKLDPTSVYECLEPGHHPSLTDCVTFYRCIVTMNCILKGFLFRCPASYAYDRRSKRCLTEDQLGRCDRVADAGAVTFQIEPVVEIQPESLEEFFQAELYWDLMGFLPNETQRIVSVQPSDFTRGSKGDVSMALN